MEIEGKREIERYFVDKSREMQRVNGKMSDLAEDIEKAINEVQQSIVIYKFYVTLDKLGLLYI